MICFAMGPKSAIPTSDAAPASTRARMRLRARSTSATRRPTCAGTTNSRTAAATTATAMTAMCVRSIRVTQPPDVSTRRILRTWTETGHPTARTTAPMTRTQTRPTAKETEWETRATTARKMSTLVKRTPMATVRVMYVKTSHQRVMRAGHTVCLAPARQRRFGWMDPRRVIRILTTR